MTVSKKSAPPLGHTLLAAWRSLAADLFGGYRPERHYMRGPGPKWREKNTVQHLVIRPDRTARPRLARIRIRI
ncbi:hypothetical protein A33M_3798 [Rhodovulum sp. PH10]|uniref:hypothetical protein n=1 Tax=Rhodovulum sp. PH10 TaxID=1187851 RepID=UPI00027C2473|nr:hypothetical protein [Rhodovulum sp. PH10]EJW13378.1 hypothetical protein A33M_3798 [Rhodovulum sp. PH10]